MRDFYEELRLEFGSRAYRYDDAVIVSVMGTKYRVMYSDEPGVVQTDPRDWYLEYLDCEWREHGDGRPVRIELVDTLPRDELEWRPGR